MADSRNLELVLIGTDRSASRTLKNLGTSASHTSRGFHTLGRSAKVAGLAIATGVGAAVVAVGAAMRVGFNEVMDYEAGLSQLNAGIKSTKGAANVTAAELEKLAGSIQSYSGQTDDSIVKAESLLLTFPRLRNEAGKTNDIFTQATKVTADMAARMGGDASASAIKLGKALNDPIAGTASLGRVGVQFSESQKATITALVETGDTLGAQKVILAELNKEFGGSAKAFGETMPGQIEIAKRKFEDFTQTLVETVLPPLLQLADYVAPKISAAFDFIQSSVEKLIGGFTGASGSADGVTAAGTRLHEMWANSVKPALQIVGDYIEQHVIPALRQLGEFVQTVVLPAFQGLVAFIADTLVPAFYGVMGPALDAAAGFLKDLQQAIEDNRPAIEKFLHAVQKIIDVVLTVLVPVLKVLIEVGFKALSTQIKITMKVFGTLIEVIDAVIGAVKAAVGAISTAAKAIGDAFQAAYDGAKSWLGKLIGLVKSLPGRIMRAIGDLGMLLYDVGKDLLQGLINGIKDSITGVLDTVGGLAGDIKNKVTGVLGIGSPSKVFHGYGVAMMEGWADGIWAASGGPLAAIGGVTDELRTAMEKHLPLAAAQAQSLMQGVKNGASVVQWTSPAGKKYTYRPDPNVTWASGSTSDVASDYASTYSSPSSSSSYQAPSQGNDATLGLLQSIDKRLRRLVNLTEDEPAAFGAVIRGVGADASRHAKGTVKR